MNLPLGGPGAGAVRPAEILVWFLRSALAFLAASLALGVLLLLAPSPGLGLPFQARWLHVHLALAMGLGQAIMGATQHFAVALLAAPPPRRPLARAQWGFANAGALGLIAGALAGLPLLAAAGGLSLMTAVALVATSLYRMLRASLQTRDLAVRFYLAALVSALVAMALGVLMLGGWAPAAAQGGSMRLAHLHLNILGFLGLTIAGTLHAFFPTVIAVPLASPSLALTTYRLWTAGVPLLAVGFLVGSTVTALAGGVVVTAAALCLTANLWRTRRQLPGPLPLAGRHLYAATWYLLATCLLGLGWLGLGALGDGPAPGWLAAYSHLGLVGWAVQTLLGAATHLLPVLAVTGRQRPGAPPAAAPPPFDRLRAILNGAAPWQTGLLNAGLLTLALGLALTAHILQRLGAAMLLGGFALFFTKVLRVFRLARSQTGASRGPSPSQ